MVFKGRINGEVYKVSDVLGFTAIIINNNYSIKAVSPVSLQEAKEIASSIGIFYPPIYREQELKTG